MRRKQRLLKALMISVLVGVLAVSSVSYMTWADTASPSLTISQLKITSSNGQFITLYNATDATLDASKYQLEYFNSYDLNKASSSKLIALSGSIPPHGYFMVNDDALTLCYRLIVDSTSLGLSSTAGFIEVMALNQTGPGSPAIPVLQDYVAWSKTPAVGAQTLPASTSAFLERLPVDAAGNPLVVVPGSGSWQSVQPDATNSCKLVSSGTNTPVATPSGLGQLLPSTEPPATIMEISEAGSATPVATLPAADVGLMAPSVTELLPNPSGTGNDSTDEFIELYNPNAVNFDLTGFSLQSGTTSLHSFTFAPGTTLPSHAFTAFYSKLTKLSLSNNGGQVKLLDPFGNSISASDTYSSAGEGQSWSLAKGKWYWTTMVTPGKQNVIKQPPAKKTAAKGAAKAKSSKGAASKIKAAKTVAATTAEDRPPTYPVHLRTLALVIGLALLYGAYEYRADMANRIYRLRRHFKDRSEDRA